LEKSFDKKIYTDILIIGGGVIGSASCYYLSKKNLDVTLVEKCGIATGSSGSCDGFVFLQSKNDRDLISLTLKSLEIFKNLGSELSYDIEFNRCGGLVIFADKYSPEDISFFLEGQKKNCIKSEVLDYNGLKKIEPFISKDAKYATYCRDEAQINPIALNFGFILEAKRKGARVFTNEEVLSFEIDKNSAASESPIAVKNRLKLVKKVITNTGRQIFAKDIILCTGAWTGNLGKVLGINIPIKPRRGNLVVTEVVPEIIRHLILDYDYICCKFDENRKMGLTVEQTKNGNLLIGSTREFTGFKDDYDLKKISQIVRRAQKYFPLLSDVSLIRIFSGFRPYSPDFKPLIGLIPSFSNLWIAAGHEGDGIALSPVTGMLVSELILRKIKFLSDIVWMGGINYPGLYRGLKDFENIDVRKFSPERISLL
jgi:sarcosine oxidase subunit beta